MTQLSGRRRPWWLIGLTALGALLLVLGLIDPDYNAIFATLLPGLAITLRVTFFSFIGALAFGVLLALGLMSPRVWLSEMTRAWVEVMRGLPVLVVLYIVMFALTPALFELYAAARTHLAWLPDYRVRDFSYEGRAVFALILAYSAFIAEILRGGILAVPVGQSEAAQALGFHHRLAMRLVVLPQALRIMLPPLGNDLVSLVKDSALVSILGLMDLTHLARVSSAANFQIFSTYMVLGFYYLVITIPLSVLSRQLERRLKSDRHHAQHGPGT